MRGIIDQAIKPFQSAGRIAYEEGPDIELRPQVSLSLTMILHELATNAVKHGALSGAAGRVVIAWRLEPGDATARVLLDWTEKDGPIVEVPAHRGHGVSFVERSVAYDLDGEAKLDFAPGGLRAAIAFPLASASMGESA